MQKKLIWWFSHFYRCKHCGHITELSRPPVDDVCAECGKAGLVRQVIEWGEEMVDYDPKKHNVF